MRIQVEKFLALTALLATTAALGVGCTTEDTATTTDAGVSGGGGTGGGGTGGATGGTAGQATGGAAGTAATGGTAGQATGGTGGTDGGACLGDTPSNPDAGTTGSIIDCTTLPYYNADCTDAGGEFALGADFCDYISAFGRPAVQEAAFECLKAVTATDACGAAHDTAVQKCMDDTYTLACQHPPLTVDGASYDPCKDIAQGCAAGDGGTGITEAECNFVLNPLTTTKVEAILLCYDTGTGTCEADFESCVALP